MNPTFWQPSNAMGTAATVDQTLEGQLVKINFYWSGMELAAEPQSQDELLQQIRGFLHDHPLVNRTGRNIFHYTRNGGQFQEIEDPGWTPSAR